MYKQFQIPIGKFESEMCTQAAKEKKSQILDLFKNNNEIRSKEEFNDIKFFMKRAVSRGDLELLEIYLSEEIKVEIENKQFSFKINKERKTASLFEIYESLDDLIVPRAIKYGSEDYLVTSIIGSGSYLNEFKRINFPENSAVNTIYEYSFYLSGVETISIPSSLIELKTGWCCYTDNLTNIIIPKSNNRFLYKDNKYLLSKSDQQNEDFDILLLARRDIKEALIPSSVKIISTCAFFSCTHLSKVEIETNSNLQTIENSAFSDTNIKQIYIPSSVSTISDCAFHYCKNLQILEISEESKLKLLNISFLRSCDKANVMIPHKIKIINS